MQCFMHDCLYLFVNERLFVSQHTDDAQQPRLIFSTMTTFALDCVISQVRGLNSDGRISCLIARVGSAQQNAGKTAEM
jgi:hypothetical protein